MKAGPRAQAVLNSFWATVGSNRLMSGLAYLAAHQGAEAAGEFQKILDHRGIVVSDPIGALAHLQLGRTYALARDMTKAKSAYRISLRSGKTPTPTSPS
jgi:Tfp pilus assembly protein PilF